MSVAEGEFRKNDTVPYALIYALTPLLLIFGETNRNLQSASLDDVVAYVVQDSENILFVNESFKTGNPTFGGITGRYFSEATHQQIEVNCNHYSSNFDAVVSIGSSLCDEVFRLGHEKYYSDGYIYIFLN